MSLGFEKIANGPEKDTTGRIGAVPTTKYRTVKAIWGVVGNMGTRRQPPKTVRQTERPQDCFRWMCLNCLSKFIWT